MDYTIPNIYVDREPNSQKVDSVMTGTTAGFIGIAERGEVGVVQVVNSWTDYVSKFAKGMVSPFYINSALAYSVYGYFQNGGGKCYIVRTAHSTASKASLLVGEAITGVTFTAKDEGVWANKLFITSSANTKNVSNFDITITSTLSGSSVVVETFTDLSNNVTSERYFKSIINSGSKYVSVSSGTLGVKVSTALAGGVDGISDITDEDYTSKIALLEVFRDISMLSIPGQTSSAVLSAMLSLSSRKRITVFPDLSPTLTPTDLVTMRGDTLKGNAFVYFPSVGNVKDPLSPVGALKEVPVSGHVMGTISRMVKERGIGQSPAGVDAVVKGFVSIDSIDPEDLELLYAAQINPILTDIDYGIILWGDKSISEDSNMTRGANLLLANYLESYIEKETRYVVFRTINETLMEAVKTQVDGILGDLWKRGNLRGNTAQEAFYSKCDSEINTEETISEGKFLCKVAYKNNESANFVIFTVSHLIN